MGREGVCEMVKTKKAKVEECEGEKKRVKLGQFEGNFSLSAVALMKRGDGLSKPEEPVTWGSKTVWVVQRENSRFATG